MTRYGYRGSTERGTTYHRDQRGCSAVPLPVANDGCLPSQADFILTWLSHMPNNLSPDIPHRKNFMEPSDISWHPNGLSNIYIQTNAGAGRYQSSDILIQNSPSRPPPHQTHHHQYRQSAPDVDHGQNLDDRERHRHSIRPISTTSETPLLKYNVFEKQPRRKIRRDRYDTRKPKVERIERGNKNKSSNRVSKRERLRSSREIIANFSSKAIANPGEKITLEQKFTPGLFVNSRSSAPLRDLAFNDIPVFPLSHETVERCEKEHLSSSEPERRKGRNSTVDSSVSYTRRSNGDDKLPAGSHTIRSHAPRSYTPRSLSIRSHTATAESTRGHTREIRKIYTAEEPSPVISRKDHTPHGQSIAERPKYEDKGIMVSPWMHERDKDNISHGTPGADRQFQSRRAAFSSSIAETRKPNTIYELPPPKVREEVIDELDLKAKRIEDTRMPPMPYFDSTSGRYPSHFLRPRFGSGLPSFDHLDAFKVTDTQWRDGYGVDRLANPIHVQPHHEASPKTNAFSQKPSEIVDDIPGETLKEYIERMEREILGPDKPSAWYIDKALLPAEANIFDTRVQTREPLRENGYHDRLPQRDQPHKSADRIPGYYQRLSYLEESTDEPEPAFVWQPSHLMWR